MTEMAPIWLSFRLALVATAILLMVSVPLAGWLAHSRWKAKAVLEALVSLPLVLPPTVLGFYLLLAFSPENSFGRLIERIFGLRLVFSFSGLVLASVLYSLPFMVNPILAGFRGLSPSLREAAATLGKSGYATMLRVLLPNIRASIITGIVLTFAHTIGEFGVVLMIGGNIPGKTKVASLAIYDEVQSLNYAVANRYALILFAICFTILLLVYLVSQQLKRSNTLP